MPRIVGGLVLGRRQEGADGSDADASTCPITVEDSMPVIPIQADVVALMPRKRPAHLASTQRARRASGAAELM
jgi:hypothetical protein